MLSIDWFAPARFGASLMRGVLRGTARACRSFMMALAGAFGGPPPKPYVHVDENAEVAEDRKP